MPLITPSGACTRSTLQRRPDSTLGDKKNIRPTCSAYLQYSDDAAHVVEQRYRCPSRNRLRSWQRLQGSQILGIGKPIIAGDSGSSLHKLGDTCSNRAKAGSSGRQYPDEPDRED